MKNVYQMDLFGGQDEKIKKKRKVKSDAQKQEEREERERKKRLQREKEFEEYWASVGHPQLYMFDDDGNIKIEDNAVNRPTKVNNIKDESKNMSQSIVRLTESDLKRIVKECIGKILKEK